MYFFFRGVILFGNESYGLEPILHSKSNEHLLFLLKDSQSEPFVCGLANETSLSEDHSHYADMSMFSRVRKYRIALLTFLCSTNTVFDILLNLLNPQKKRNLPQTKYVELVIVVDNQRVSFSH